MNLKEIMSRNVQVVDPDCTLHEAAQMMKDLDVGGLPVCGGDKLLGYITDRDIVIRAIAEGKDPHSCTVNDMMTKEINWCYEIEKAGQLMKEKQIRRLLVMDRNKKLVGIVSLGDMAVGGEDEEFTGSVLESVSEPTEMHQPTA